MQPVAHAPPAVGFDLTLHQSLIDVDEGRSSKQHCRQVRAFRDRDVRNFAFFALPRGDMQ